MVLSPRGVNPCPLSLHVGAADARARAAGLGPARGKEAAAGGVRRGRPPLQEGATVRRSAPLSLWLSPAAGPTQYPGLCGNLQSKRARDWLLSGKGAILDQLIAPLAHHFISGSDSFICPGAPPPPRAAPPRPCGLWKREEKASRGRGLARARAPPRPTPPLAHAPPLLTPLAHSSPARRPAPALPPAEAPCQPAEAALGRVANQRVADKYANVPPLQPVPSGSLGLVGSRRGASETSPIALLFPCPGGGRANHAAPPPPAPPPGPVPAADSSKTQILHGCLNI
ncbi:unnamed protein product [Caretta caretta]